MRPSGVFTGMTLANYDSQIKACKLSVFSCDGNHPTTNKPFTPAQCCAKKASDITKKFADDAALFPKNLQGVKDASGTYTHFAAMKIRFYRCIEKKITDAGGAVPAGLSAAITNALRSGTSTGPNSGNENTTNE